MIDGGTQERRTVATRMGITLLNLLMPGVGLIRTGKLRSGFRVIAALFLLMIGLWACSALLPTITAGLFRPLLALILLWYASLIAGSMIATWRRSKVRAARVPVWSRWYGLLAVTALCLVASNLLSDRIRSHYRAFYLPSEAMSPTMQVGERFYADMSIDPAQLRRGDVILIQVGGSIYVKRLVGLPGDRVAMVEGVPVINGRPAEQVTAGTVRGEELGERYEARVLVERMPGGSRPFRILDRGHGLTDEMAETVVSAGRVFVLGDNRDRSADSRVSRTEGGVAMAPLSDVVGQPLFKTWTADWRWLGTDLR